MDCRHRNMTLKRGRLSDLIVTDLPDLLQKIKAEWEPTR